MRPDWRFLLPSGPRRHLLVVGEAGRRWQFLVEDEWVERLTTTVDDAARSVVEPDIVVVDGDVDPAPALAVAGPHALAVLALGRRPTERARRVGALTGAGFAIRARYLATPNLAQATRLVPIDRPDALRWLLAPPPPVAGVDTGLRRRLQSGAVEAGAGLLGLGARRAEARLSSLFGAGAEGLVVAERSSGSTNTAPPILMTSGHDEGSRAVVVDPPGDGRTGRVIKIAPRPRYNRNVEAEVDVIAATRNRLGPDLAEVLPSILDTVEVDGLIASVEGYGGRWTVADLCHRVPAARAPMLERLLALADRLAAATVDAEAGPWTADRFDQLIGNRFDQLADLAPRSPSLTALRVQLAERSRSLEGVELPMVQRHYDLGPWNVVVSDDGTALTIIDWELAPPRVLGAAGPAGADQIYAVKYWLHAAMATESMTDELSAFEFLDPARGTGSRNTDQAPDPRPMAAAALRRSLTRLAVDPRFVPLLTVYTWLEKALYTAARRAGSAGSTGPDPGPALAYLTVLARHRTELLDFWS